MKRNIIILLLLLFASPLCAEIIDNGDSTVTDTKTGLMWRKYDNGANVSYTNAVIYTENLNYGKYANWRIPTMSEVKNIALERNFTSGGLWSNQIDDYSQQHYCYAIMPGEGGYLAFCTSARVFPVRNPQYDVDKIYTQAQMDDALNNATQAERTRWDADGDNKIGMAEAIRALQVVSGSR